MSATPSDPKRRRSARVILLSPNNEVLLIKFVVPRSHGQFTFWATPGGEVAEGESDLLAAARELREELNLALELEGPVHSATAEFEHKGSLVNSTDVFFLAHCSRDAPGLHRHTEEERAVIRTCRWWSLGELEATEQPVFPDDLHAVLRGLCGT